MVCCRRLRWSRHPPCLLGRHQRARTRRGSCAPLFEVHMSGRRSHPRFAVATPWDGAMRVLRDVVVDRVSREELLVISQAPAIAGEDMTLDLVGAGTTMELRVRVLESRPVIIEGTVRHRIRLSVMQRGVKWSFLRHQSWSCRRTRGLRRSDDGCTGRNAEGQRPGRRPRT